MPLEAGQSYDYQFWNDVESKRKGHLHHVVLPVDRGDVDAVAPRNRNLNIPAGHGKTVWAIQVAQVCVPEGDELPAEYTEPVAGCAKGFFSRSSHPPLQPTLDARQEGPPHWPRLPPAPQ